MILLDTSACILLRDGDATAMAKAAEWQAAAISVVTRVELEAGLLHPVQGSVRRARLMEFLSDVLVLELGAAEAETYAAILAHAGFSRRKLLGRLIAATALVHGLPLATLNRQDFADVPGLDIVDWSGGGSAG